MLRAVERAFRPGDVGTGDRGAQVFHGYAIGGEPREIRLDADGWLQSAEHRDAPDAGNLAQPLRQKRIGDVAHRPQRDCVGAQRQRHHRRIGRVHLGVGRRIRQRLGQHAGRRVDRSLDVLGGTVDVAVEIELQRDLADAERARRVHRRQRRDLAELPLQGRGDQRGDHVGARAGQLRRHLHGREIDLRQRGHRQREIAEQPANQKRDAEQ
ncbi:hypothetical protein ACVWZK_005684 [Bradyrhizobium sp. GM0.4]